MRRHGARLVHAKSVGTCGLDRYQYVASSRLRCPSVRCRKLRLCNLGVSWPDLASKFFGGMESEADLANPARQTSRRLARGATRKFAVEVFRENRPTGNMFSSKSASSRQCRSMQHCLLLLVAAASLCCAAESTARSRPQHRAVW